MTGFARVQENMRRIKNLAQFFLRNKSGKRNAIVDLEVAHQFLKFCEQRSAPGDCQSRSRIARRETGKGPQASRQTLFFDQTAGLYESPFTVLREIAFAKW